MPNSEPQNRFATAFAQGLAALLVTAVAAGCRGPVTSADDAAPSAELERMDGFVDLYWDEAGGRLLLGIDALDEPLLYQSSLPRGVGSNDLGLDRGQLGSTRVVRFSRVGPKLLMREQNLGYRALTDDADEQNAVAESFAEAVVHGFDIVEERDGQALVDATDFFLSDSHSIVERLDDLGEGTFAVDGARSAIYLPRTRAFPDNSEVEATVTFVGRATGAHLATVTPDYKAFTVHLHHSFIRLPDDDYEPLPYDPRAGIIGVGYGRDGFLDYASGIGEDMTVRYGRRHRLEKVDPSAARSAAVEPIVYYVDRAAPEPIRSALIEGASWWNEAFEAAGYEDAFVVELMPEGADPMDVRYNVIQWVHRSTRGWSYGSSIVDPRTGEILKGHVTLGSLRVRQDYMIAEGLLAPYGNDDEAGDAALEMALARIRQLSAHEVGHTIGMEHNFAASTQDRSSVMDYPFPLIGLGDNGRVDLSEAYAVGMGRWDLRTVLYAYQDFPDDADDVAERAGIMAETLASGLRYVTDDDSRAVGTAHPDGNLWDNGANALDELERLLEIRGIALERFSAGNIRRGRPLATLEETLVPIYLLHRYQIQAVGKLIGGERFNYALKGDGQRATDPVDGDEQRAAIRALVRSIAPDILRLPEPLIDAIPPRPSGYSLNRETFARRTGKTFDAVAPARAVVSLTLDVLLDPSRAARMIAASARQEDLPGFGEALAALTTSTWYAGRLDGLEAEIQRATNVEVLVHLLHLAHDAEADAQVRALALDAIDRLDDWLAARPAGDPDAGWLAHRAYLAATIARVENDPAALEQLAPSEAPPGSPI